MSELKSIRQFVRGQLREEDDLSLLTLGILKKRYLANVGGEALSSSTKGLLKQVVEQELMKMMENNKSDDESETEDFKSKRKRDVENESEDEDASKQKKSRCGVISESESEERPGSGKGSVESAEEENTDDEKKKMRKSPQKVECEKNSEDQSDYEAQSCSNKNDSSSQSSEESEKEENISAEKNPNQDDSDSSSLPSLKDEQQPKNKEKQISKKKKNGQDTENTKSTKKGKDDVTKKQKENDKTIIRLKRYISLCGERRNYKSLLGDCRSVRSMVAVLKKELEDLGVCGQPSIEKCKRVRLKREKAKELAELDASNIIESEGRPKRRGAFTQLKQSEPPLATYQRSVNSDSDSDEESSIRRGHKRTSDWANLKGIISDDASSE
ncbi:HIRA-interacting protein 3 [Corythoichthys intestinalis]|uniref:HIRA-interacting protein 3 n=1 Tax=Corythoichthys intestinalis TaxID=161448 RepID=UPI0025A5F398|nr:HIRA-interacting protein 3 [Corythoichthys intestinalis]XP_061804980.1 HIRA-interacting protein 3-like [Nerophis lumbriciformis]